MALPFLPGNSFDRNLGKDRYHKSHHFDAKNQVTFMFGDDRPGIGGDRLPGQRFDAPKSRYPGGQGSNQPAWVAFDKQVLSFDAFFQEAVEEKREEQFRVRHVKLYFYLEDDSIQVVEPRIKNSALPQGTIIRRHRISRPAPRDEEYYTVDDFNVGQEVTLYNKVFRLVSCDEFTANFLRKMGVKIGHPESIPNDPYSNVRKGMDESMQPLRPYERHDTLRQFLDHDRHVLRFYCFWDDTESLYGDPREMVLHYFLADDTVEIRETISANSGRDAAPCFLKRQKLPKNVGGIPLPGQVADRTVLNVIGPITSGRYILDNLKTGTLNTEFYTDKDLTIGTYLNVYGRKYLICGCDEFTKEYYRTKYGVNDFQTLGHQPSSSGGILMAREDSLPPYNGWGQEEDTAGNCKSMLPKPPKRDFIKFMEKDRRGHESNVLRFKARMVTDHPIDSERRFIISYFLSDDTMLVHEPPIRNSGVLGGKFLERGKMRLPGQEKFSTELPKYYQASDLHIGATLLINQFKFNLIDADEYAYRYMEGHPSEYPLANISRILGKLRQSPAVANKDMVKAQFAQADPHSTGTISFEQMQSLLTHCMGDGLTAHEIITVARYYSDRPAKEENHIQMVGIAQQQLRKENFDQFAQLTEMCVHVDRDGTGRLTPLQVRNACRCFKVPIHDDLLRALLQSCTEENGKTDYRTFLCSLNWREHPVAGVAEFTGSVDANWHGTESHCQIDKIRYECLIEDLCGGK